MGSTDRGRGAGALKGSPTRPLFFITGGLERQQGRMAARAGARPSVEKMKNEDGYP